MQREVIVEAARNWIDVPYRHQGRDRKGIDCIGLTWAVAKDLGYEATIPANYSQSPSGNQILKGCDTWLIKQDRMDLRPGDIAIFWGRTRGEAQHFAIIGEMSARLTMIHAWSRHWKVVEHSYHRFWETRLMAIYCLPNTED